MPSRWTGERDQILTDEWQKGTTIPKIAIMVNKTETAINARVHRLRLGRRITQGLGKRANGAGFHGLKIRPCLMCGTKFQTEWKQQWVCNPCRSTSLWRNSDGRV